MSEIDHRGLGVNQLRTVATPVTVRNNLSRGSSPGGHEKPIVDIDVESTHGVHDHVRSGPESNNILYEKIGIFINSKYAVYMRDFCLLALLVGWWIVAIANDRPEIRHRWIPSTVIVWFFVLFILLHNSRYVPQQPFVRGISAAWNTLLGKPWGMLPYYGKLGLGWTALAVLIFGSTYGLRTNSASSCGNRTISLVGLCLIYGGLFVFSNNHKAVKARTTILGIGLQFVVGLFVFRTGTGYSLFRWISVAAADLLGQAQAPTGRYSVGGGAAFFWSTDFVNENHFFFVNVLSSIIFFVALCIALFYFGVLQWSIQKFAWFFYKTFGISGGEAVVAVASPFIGQGENCVLVRPFVKTFTRSEFHQVLVSGFATIAGSVYTAYVLLGVSSKDLITSSVMSIPGSIAASKIVYPETEEPDTAGRVVVDRQESEDGRAHNFFEALSNGASLGLQVALLVFCNVLVLVTLVTTINGILAWIGNALYITDSNGPLTLQLIVGYLLWPITFMLGVPRADVPQVSQLFALKLLANEFVAYNTLQGTVMKSANPLSERGYLICKYGLCGFANFGSVGISIGVLSAMAPSRRDVIVKLAFSAMITGALVTFSSAAIAGIVADPALSQS